MSGPSRPGGFPSSSTVVWVFLTGLILVILCIAVILLFVLLSVLLGNEPALAHPAPPHQDGTAVPALISQDSVAGTACGREAGTEPTMSESQKAWLLCAVVEKEVGRSGQGLICFNARSVSMQTVYLGLSAPKSSPISILLFPRDTGVNQR